MNEDEKITQWFINIIKGTPNEEQLALKKVYEQNEEIENLKQEIERLNNIIVKLKKVLWQRCEEARKNEQYVRLNCYKDILNELVNTIYEVDGKTNKEW